MAKGVDNLNAIERKMVYELENDGSLGIRELGGKLGISNRLTQYYLYKLIRKKVIVKFVAVIDFSKLGFVNHEVWIQIRNVSKEVKKGFLDSLVAHKRVAWVATCGGKFDYAISILAEDSVTFSEILKDILTKNKGIVSNYYITICTRIMAYPRTYMLEKTVSKRTGHLFFSGPPRRVRLDEKDFSIISVLSKESKISAKEIGKRVGMSVNSVRQRVRKLEANQVIQGYKAIIQPSVLGTQNYEILIATEGINVEKEAEMDQYCRSNPYATLFTSCIGRWDIDLAVDAKDLQHLQDTISDIRELFGSTIKDFEFVPILHVHKFNLGAF